ncbi:hypothetical protein TCAL_16572 [Tigriopus californicus]|uniref:Uncharacterized protein n=1 Tax=Tigriopus californicus TaxID=6832 RepID=A0A553NBF9_TIGCA|nr:hypothetical protein TCAL_16572 [Tigriopus californicus]
MSLTRFAKALVIRPSVFASDLILILVCGPTVATFCTLSKANSWHNANIGAEWAKHWMIEFMKHVFPRTGFDPVFSVPIDQFFRTNNDGIIIVVLVINLVIGGTLGKHEEQSKVIVEKWLGGSNQEILSQADLYQNDEDFDNEAILKSPPYTKMTKKSHRLDDDYGDLEITFQDLHDTRESILAVLDGISTESDNIFFVEFNDQKPEYHCIELCSIESARLQNPGAQIYIILNGMERDIFGASNPLEHHKHIRVINMNLKEFLYQEMAVTFETSFNKSTVIQSPEMRELVRSLLLYHKGGVSLEADTISVRPLPFNDNNFLSLSNNGFVNADSLYFIGKERHPLTTLMHLQDLPKAICDSLEEVELPNMLTAMMRSACPNTFQIISSKVDDDLSWT